MKDAERPATTGGPISKSPALRSKSLAVEMVEQAVSRLKALETFKDRTAAGGAVLALRQMVIQLEERGLALRGDFDRCMDVIKVLEWE